ncbi:Armadillo repeat-containing protein 3 [Harpegnathos saltator]|uniref:Armadillo repeat-containing protein 3 n=2 Tax=Harpegnathos saltator TaxID=610380 RepID=E2BSH1_HARSA|nr:Armadillo repeat-containing protein 3 [Harpegnathos saltator]
MIQTISTDLVVADAFIKSKYLQYMLNNRSSARIISSWDSCIQTLFKSHLPAKFTFTGRLSLYDITQDGFYVVRKSICPFPALDEIFRLKCSPIEPIYTVNFSRPSTPLSALQNEVPFEGDINSQLELKYGRLQHDPYLIEYVELFKNMLSIMEPQNVATALDIGLTNIQYISSRSKTLAQFVARQLSGFDPENKCIPHQVEIHLKEIKQRLGTSVIPLGQLRVGSYLERALLFKVIADRICLPAALVRGGYGISWIEIAVPRIKDSDEEKSSRAYFDENDEYRSKITMSVSLKLSNKSDAHLHDDKYKTEKVSPLRDDRSTIYPIKHMRPNFIVDLMDTPGDLIPIGSPRSKLYCTVNLTCNKKCCQ